MAQYPMQFKIANADLFRKNSTFYNFLGNEFLVKIYKLLQKITFEIDTLPKIM